MAEQEDSAPTQPAPAPEGTPGEDKAPEPQAAEEKPAEQPQPLAAPDTKDEAAKPAEPEAAEKPPAEPAPKAEPEGAEKPPAEPAPKAEPQAAEKPKAKPAPKAEPQAAEKPKAKPEADKPAPKAATDEKADAKAPTAKPDAKGDAEGKEAKPAAKKPDQPAPKPSRPAPPVPPGKHYFWGTGRRKKAVARVRIRPGTGQMVINKRDAKEYFDIQRDREAILEPLQVAKMLRSWDVWANVRGGGYTGQAGAVVMGLARALARAVPDIESELRAHGLLTRDARMSERKKPGQPGARKRFQFSKR